MNFRKSYRRSLSQASLRDFPTALSIKHENGDLPAILESQVGHYFYSRSILFILTNRRFPMKKSFLKFSLKLKTIQLLYGDCYKEVF